ncbi:MAG: glycine--tRNA ligase subunit beta [Desulfobacterium sp.]|nr:glycine--tRNA ligase subunit beta [Desulfobacterium sp.]
MEKLLLEIGTEEIPAGYIEPALKALSAALLKKMDDARISHGNAKTYGTPRRLAIEVSDVAEKQEPVTSEVMGPPERVGFDETGKPTVAAVKFAEKVGIPVSSIRVSETQKGRYLVAVKTEKGLATKTILKSILPEVIDTLPFPKSMKWSDMNILFARPIQTVLALLGKEVVSFSIERLKSGRCAMGHPFMAPGKITIEFPDQYVEALEAVFVFADIEKRKQLILKTVASVAEGLGGRVQPDEDLTDIVTNLVEYPVPIAGSFDTKFLELPKEVLIMAMREHQKYFAVVDDRNQLKPNFIAVNNTRAKDMSLVAKGHERVLRARLEDAMFFYRADLKTDLDQLVDKLKGVLFQAKLGSVYEKIKRVQKLGEFLVEKSGQDESVKLSVSRAAWLCKADLVSRMVVEFPKLQGIMGRVYAKLAGESDPVVTAIEEHYRPVYSGAPLPETKVGSLLAIADKLDSICGCFHAGLIPTGASDPYALRRQGIGIIQIIQKMNFTFSLKEVIEKSVSLFGGADILKIQETAGQIYSFLQDRISHMLADEGFQKDVIAAVISVSVDNIPDLRKRVKALESMKNKPDFEPLAIAFKRAVNILKKADSFQGGEVSVSLFEESCESDLYNACKSVRQKVAVCLAEGNFDRALIEISGLRDVVDAFFDGVMVMAENPDVKNNRLALLSEIAVLFKDIADFSRISV